jgi:hypothetical protein
MAKKSTTEIQPIDISDLIPGNYLTMSKKKKKEACIIIFEILITNITPFIPDGLDKFEVIRKVIEVTIRENEKYEQFEVCLILKDMIELMDEA